MCLHELVWLVTKESTRCDNKDSEPQAQMRLLKIPQKIKSIQRDMFSKAFCHFPNVRMRTNVFREEPQL